MNKKINLTEEKIVEILNINFYCTDFGMDYTIKDYLRTQLITLWEEKEDFSGKRPFGNSSWEWEIFAVLIKNKIIDGSLDEDGYVETGDGNDGTYIIRQLINYIFEQI